MSNQSFVQLKSTMQASLLLVAALERRSDNPIKAVISEMDCKSFWQAVAEFEAIDEEHHELLKKKHSFEQLIASMDRKSDSLFRLLAQMFVAGMLTQSLDSRAAAKFNTYFESAVA